MKKVTEEEAQETYERPILLFQQSFWPDCRCPPCFAIHMAERFHIEKFELLEAIRNMIKYEKDMAENANYSDREYHFIRKKTLQDLLSDLGVA